MLVAVPKEIRDGEKRVALVPDIINKLTRLGLEVLIESGAGVHAQASDDAYRAAGAQVVAGDVLKSADVVLSVTALTPQQIATLKKGAITISFLSVVNQRESIDAAVAAGITAFSLELVPRISRAQSMDALTSQALCAGSRISCWRRTFTTILPHVDDCSGHSNSGSGVGSRCRRCRFAGNCNCSQIRRGCLCLRCSAIIER